MGRKQWKGTRAAPLIEYFTVVLRFDPFPCNEGEAGSAFVLMQTQFSFLVEMKLKNTY